MEKIANLSTSPRKCQLKAQWEATVHLQRAYTRAAVSRGGEDAEKGYASVLFAAGHGNWGNHLDKYDAVSSRSESHDRILQLDSESWAENMKTVTECSVHSSVYGSVIFSVETTLSIDDG